MPPATPNSAAAGSQQRLPLPDRRPASVVLDGGVQTADQRAAAAFRSQISVHLNRRIRSLDSTVEYYRRWASVWERQALLRARPVAGDRDLGRTFIAMTDPLRYPAGGVTESEVREIRRLKARMEAERLPRGVDATRHTKLGRGGLSDVEWSVQLLQLRHAAEVPGLRTTSTLEALGAARDRALLPDEDADVLRQAWVTATRVRNAVVLARGRPSDVLPTDSRGLAAVARAMGYAAGHTGELEEDYRRAARRARRVHEKLFAS